MKLLLLTLTILTTIISFTYSADVGDTDKCFYSHNKLGWWYYITNNNCSEFNICESHVTFDMPGRVPNYYFNGCLNQNKNAKSKIIAESNAYNPWKKCNQNKIKIRNTHCYNTPYANNRRKKTSEYEVNATVTYVAKVNKHCLTRYGWCSC